MPLAVHATRRVEQGLQVEHGVEIVADLLLAAQADERGAQLVDGDAEIGRPVSSSPARKFCAPAVIALNGVPWF